MILKTNDSDVPCVGIIDFNIFIHKILNDGSIDPEILDCSTEFAENDASTMAQITITGINKKDCVNKIKILLQKLTSVETKEDGS